MDPAVSALLVLLVCVVLFITNWIPASMTAVLGCMLMYFVGACDFAGVFAGFADNIVVLVVGSMIVGVAMFDTGTARVIAKQCIRLSGGSERRFILFAGVVSGILSAFIANTAVVACFLPIIDSVARSSRMSRRNMTMAITFGAMYGGSLTLVGSTPQLTANGILEPMVGYGVQMYDYLGPGLCVFVCYVIYTQLVGYPLGMKIWGGRPEVDSLGGEDPDAVLNAAVDKRKVVLMLCIFGAMIISYSFQVIPTALTAAVAGLLCIVLRLTDEESAFRGISWGPVFMLAGTLGIATGLTESGAAELMADAVFSLMGGGVPPMLMFAVFVLLSTVISNFAANSTTVIILLPMAIGSCLSYGRHPLTFTIGITMAATLACCTPIAHPQVTMTLVAGYRFSDYVKYNGIMAVIANAVIILTTPLFFPFV